MKQQDRSIRERKRKTIRTYLKEFQPEIKNIDDQVILCRMAQDGDMNAMTLLVDTHRKLVHNIAAKYQNQGLGLDELLYTGNIGLIKAIHRYGDTRDVDFTTYATWWVRQCLRKALGEQARIMQLAQFTMTDMTMIGKSFHHWEQHDDKEPTVKDLDNFLNSKVYEIAKLNPADGQHNYEWLPKA